MEHIKIEDVANQIGQLTLMVMNANGQIEALARENAELKAQLEDNNKPKAEKAE